MQSESLTGPIRSRWSHAAVGLVWWVAACAGPPTADEELLEVLDEIRSAAAESPGGALPEGLQSRIVASATALAPPQGELSSGRAALLMALVGSGLDLRGVLQEASFAGADLHGATLASRDPRDTLAKAPSGEASPDDQNLTGRHTFTVVLSGIDLRGADLTAADLHGANLSGARLLDCVLAVANLQSAAIDRADLRNADLHGADLRDASLVQADLRGANLDNAQLDGADTTGAQLRD